MKTPPSSSASAVAIGSRDPEHAVGAGFHPVCRPPAVSRRRGSHRGRLPPPHPPRRPQAEGGQLRDHRVSCQCHPLFCLQVCVCGGGGAPSPRLLAWLTTTLLLNPCCIRGAWEAPESVVQTVMLIFPAGRCSSPLRGGCGWA